jgi:flagellar biosynthesis GTPase FlhF
METTTTTKLDLLAEQIRQRILQSKARVDETAPSSPVPTESHRRQHYKFPLLLAAVASDVDAVALVGPAGTGKTTAAANVAAVLKRSFEATSFGPHHVQSRSVRVH